MRSENFYGRAGSVLGSTFPDGNGGLSTPQRRSDAEGSSDESDGLSRRRHQSSVLSSSSSSGMADAALVPYTGTEVDESGLESIAMSQAKENFNMSSLTGVLVCTKLSFIL